MSSRRRTGTGGDVSRRGKGQGCVRGLSIAALVVGALISSHPMEAEELSRAARDAVLRRAQVWIAPAVPWTEADFAGNPGGEDSLAADATVECRFQPNGVGGSTPKFDCELDNGDEVKVKYGRDNPEVFAEVIASRLLASLGFPTDRMYVVERVRCLGCPEKPFEALQCLNDGTPKATCFPEIDYSRVVVFEDAVIERPAKGRRIEMRRDRGWRWDELQRIDPSADGATRAQVDALRLMAAFLAHWDNKSKNQRLLCLDAGKGEACDRPLAMVQDLGDAFGPFKLDLDGWRKFPVWSDVSACRVSMRTLPYGGSTFPDATISEEGRTFLAERLKPVGRRELIALLTGARLDRYRPKEGRVAPVEEWADVMLAKIRTITDRPPCPTR